METENLCVHGLPVLVSGNTQEECQLCDWCPSCEAIREYDHEVCKTCGYVWGEQ